MATKLFVTFIKIGILGFGGGLSIIQLIYDSIGEFVEISKSDFANIVAISQGTPGPLATNVATYIGYESDGILGAFVSTLAVTLPSFIIIYIIARFIYANKKIGNNILQVLRPLALSLICIAAVTLSIPTFQGGEKIGGNIISINSKLDIFAIIITISTFVLAKKFKVSSLKILIIMGAIGALLGI